MVARVMQLARSQLAVPRCIESRKNKIARLKRYIGRSVDPMALAPAGGEQGPGA